MAAPSLYCVTDFGARGDGNTLDTRAIQSAIDAAASAGGGRVLVPAGHYKIGTLHLRNGITLDLATGATLFGSPDIADYPNLAERQGDRHGHHLIVAEGVSDITICGGGVIDGNGPAFWKPQAGPVSWIGPKTPRVSPMFEIRNCRNVRLQDITITDSPGWTVHMFCCDYVWVRGVKLINPLFGPNTDGFDINGCRDVTISDTHIECGDDAIVLKTTKDARSSHRVSVTNCVIRTHCVALKFGTESWHDCSQILFSDCIVHHSTRAVGLYVFDGGTLSDVAVSNILCDTNSGFVLNRAIHLDLRKRHLPGQPERSAIYGDAPDRLGRIRNVSIDHVVCRTEGRLLLTAADGGRLENIALTNIRMTYPYIEDPKPLGPRLGAHQFSGHSPEAQTARGVVVAENIDNFVLRDLLVQWPTGSENLAEWGDTERLENKDRVVGKELIGKPTPPMHAVWGRGIRGGLIDIPLATASLPDMPAHDLSSCEALTVR